MAISDVLSEAIDQIEKYQTNSNMYDDIPEVNEVKEHMIKVMRILDTPPTWPLN